MGEPAVLCSMIRKKALLYSTNGYFIKSLFLDRPFTASTTTLPLEAFLLGVFRFIVALSEFHTHSILILRIKISKTPYSSLNSLAFSYSKKAYPKSWKRLQRRLFYWIGAAGFEPTTPTTPKWCATKLRYAPN